VLLPLPVVVPLALAVAVYLTPSRLWRPRLLALGAAIHLLLVGLALRAPAGSGGDWLRLDAPGRLLLLLVSVLFLVCAVYAVGYLEQRPERENRRFTACMLAVLGAMSLVAYAQHLGLLWVGIEATTLASAPLVYFNRSARSIEATWKYLLISSVGIALALLGSFFVGYAALLGGGEASLLFPDLLARAGELSRPWLRTGFALLLVGYGTKMGLAPMHTWKPDAYGEAPGVVGAVLAGGLTSCAFLALLRFTQLTAAAGEGIYANRLLIAIGLLSMAVAGALLLGQRDLSGCSPTRASSRWGSSRSPPASAPPPPSPRSCTSCSTPSARPGSSSRPGTSTGRSAARRPARSAVRCGACRIRARSSSSASSRSPARPRSASS